VADFDIPADLIDRRRAFLTAQSDYLAACGMASPYAYIFPKRLPTLRATHRPCRGEKLAASRE
jgi:hypothetical protein